MYAEINSLLEDIVDELDAGDLQEVDWGTAAHFAAGVAAAAKPALATAKMIGSMSKAQRLAYFVKHPKVWAKVVAASAATRGAAIGIKAAAGKIRNALDKRADKKLSPDQYLKKHFRCPDGYRQEDGRCVQK